MKNRRIISFILAAIMIFALLPIVSFAAPADVASFAQLKAALENPEVTQIRLINNIQMEKDKDITISPFKTSLVIEGNNHYLFQAESSKSSYSIQFDSSKSAIRNILIKDLIIYGRSKSGLIYIPTCSRYSDFTVTFDNIDYNGPELIRAKYSNVVIKDSNILVIPGYNDVTGYLAETANTTLEGTVVINKESPSSFRTLFAVATKGSMIIAQGADVTINNNTIGSTLRTSGFVFFARGSCAMRFENYSKFTYNGTSSFTFGCDTGTVYVGENANVNILIDGNIFFNEGLISVRDAMIVDNNSTFKIIAANNNNLFPVIECQNRSTIMFNSPREVLIYNASTKACNRGLAIGNTLNMDIRYNSINRLEYWIQNSTPYYNLRTPNYNWQNSSFSAAFNAYSTLCTGVSKSATTSSYMGLTPWTTNTSALKNVNVIRIAGRSYIEI